MTKEKHNMVSFNGNHQFTDVLTLAQSTERWFGVPVLAACFEIPLAHIHFRTARQQAHIYIEIKPSNGSDEVLKSIWQTVRQFGLHSKLGGSGRGCWTLNPLTLQEAKRLMIAVAVILREAKQQGGSTNEKQRQ